jgi:hypothetical protein
MNENDRENIMERAFPGAPSVWTVIVTPGLLTGALPKDVVPRQALAA